MADEETFHEVTEYKAPSWCDSLKMIPKYRIPLAMKPTPIHRWHIEGLPDGFEVSVKRDDLTGSTLSGNKVRKLEFILADAKVKGYTDVITSGSTQSNHARATMIAARELGMKCHLLLHDLHQDCRTTTPSGNFLLLEASEPDIYLLPWTSFSDENVERKQRIIMDKVQETPGRTVYSVPPGIDTPLGIFGYIDAWREMLTQNIQERFDDIVVTTGSSETACGLAIGNHLTGSKLRIHGIIISRSKEMDYGMIDEMLLQFGIENVCSKDIIDIIGGHIGKGYGVYTEEDIDFSKFMMRTTGICCDPVYIGKAVKGLIKELNANPKRFKGKRILFIHTGRKEFLEQFRACNGVLIGLSDSAPSLFAGAFTASCFNGDFHDKRRLSRNFMMYVNSYGTAYRKKAINALKQVSVRISFTRAMMVPDRTAGKRSRPIHHDVKLYRKMIVA